MWQCGCPRIDEQQLGRLLSARHGKRCVPLPLMPEALLPLSVRSFLQERESKTIPAPKIQRPQRSFVRKARCAPSAYDRNLRCCVCPVYVLPAPYYGAPVGRLWTSQFSPDGHLGLAANSIAGAVAHSRHIQQGKQQKRPAGNRGPWKRKIHACVQHDCDQAHAPGISKRHRNCKSKRDK